MSWHHVILCFCVWRFCIISNNVSTITLFALYIVVTHNNAEGIVGFTIYAASVQGRPHQLKLSMTDKVQMAAPYHTNGRESVAAERALPKKKQMFANNSFCKIGVFLWIKIGTGSSGFNHTGKLITIAKKKNTNYKHNVKNAANNMTTVTWCTDARGVTMKIVTYPKFIVWASPSVVIVTTR